ncbi:glycoside hydrolase family 5 protein [Viridothelium virens]|uniref:Endoglucanase EG-II n=1 Tax=Viridothelium virens TaxID=1048519 RepID=A0A6A6HFQ7_VIRVR|nr:glycoside hydrolase family 5 protein [Viridothelium virens]
MKTTNFALGLAIPAASTFGQAQAALRYGGVNIAGFDFGCDTSGNCVLSEIAPPGANGTHQIDHFVSEGLNAFRLPVGWQFLVNNNLGGTLDSNNLAQYDGLVQSCLSVAQLCIVDIHNYARYNGAIIGQGGPTNAQFASLWSQLAKKYASQPKIAFGVMNEPHDTNIAEWAVSVQAAVTAIRNAGASSQIILLPGNDYTSAGSYISDGSAAALSNVTNPNGSTTNLIFDVHKYLDSDNSGTHSNCVTNNIDSAFSPLATYLRQNKRQAFLSETGGGPTDPTCLTNLCQQLEYLQENSDVYLGYTSWAAGSFATSYTLSETPFGSGTALTDQELVTQCVVGVFTGKYTNGTGQ